MVIMVQQTAITETLRQVPPPRKRLNAVFVDAVAWIGILGCALGSFGGIVGTLILREQSLGVDREIMASALRDSGASFVQVFLSANRDWLYPALTVMMILACVSSVGLLRRKNWARFAVMGFLCLYIAWIVGGIVFAVTSFTVFESDAESLHRIYVPLPFFWAAMVAFAGKIAILAWVVWRLTTPAIQAEFSTREAAS